MNHPFLLLLVAVLSVALCASWAKGFLRQPPLLKYACQIQHLIQKVTSPAPYALANVAEGQALNGQGTYTSEATGTFRYAIAKLGSGPLKADICGATDRPIGILTDQPNNGDPIAVSLLGAAVGTQKVAINSTVNDGDWLSPAASGYAQTLPTTDGTRWVIGRARLSAATAGAGDTIEFIPCSPFKVTYATGVATLGV